jgi:hypothetical protein
MGLIVAALLVVLGVLGLAHVVALPLWLAVTLLVAGVLLVVPLRS